MKLEGSPKGLSALATTAPTTISKMRAPHMIIDTHPALGMLYL